MSAVLRGRVIAETPARAAALDLPDRPARVDPADYAPGDVEGEAR